LSEIEFEFYQAPKNSLILNIFAKLLKLTDSEEIFLYFLCDVIAIVSDGTGY